MLNLQESRTKVLKNSFDTKMAAKNKEYKRRRIQFLFEIRALYSTASSLLPSFLWLKGKNKLLSRNIRLGIFHPCCSYRPLGISSESLFLTELINRPKRFRCIFIIQLGLYLNGGKGWVVVHLLFPSKFELFSSAVDSIV